MWSEGSGGLQDDAVVTQESIAPGKDDWYVEIDTEHDRAELTNYALKKCKDNIDGILVKFVPIRASI